MNATKIKSVPLCVAYLVALPMLFSQVLLTKSLTLFVCILDLFPSYHDFLSESAARGNRRKLYRVCRWFQSN